MAFLADKFDERFVKHVEETGFLNYVKNGGLFALNDFKCGAIKADIFKPEGTVTFCSAQTLWRRLDKLDPDMYDCLIIDECHTAVSKTYSQGILHFNPKLRIGLTATPSRMDNIPLSNLFEKIVYEYNIDKGIKNGFLCELDAIRIKTNINLDKVHTLGGDFNQKELADEINNPVRNNLVVESYKKYALGKQGLFYGCDIQHCVDLANMFQDHGLNFKAVSSNEAMTPNRSVTIKSYLKGDVDGLVNVMLLTKGFNHPDTGCIGTATPTKSLTKYMQIIGRGTRLKSTEFVSRFGQKCTILDFLDSTNRHNLINTWSLDEGKSLEEKLFITQEKREKILADRLKRASKVDVKRDEDERVNLLPLPKVTFILSPQKKREMATTAQLQAISKWGYEIAETEYTKEQISQIFSLQQASEKQRKFLEWKGYDCSSGVNIVQAKMAFLEIEKRKK